MSEEVLESKLDEYIRKVSRNAIEEFSPSNILDLPTDIGDDAVKSMAKPMLDDELEEKNELYRRQYRAVIDSVEDGESDVHVQEYLDADPFYQSYEGDRPRIFKADLLDRMEIMKENLQPLIEADGESFDRKLVEAYDEPREAEEAIKNLFNHSEILEPYKREFDMKLDLDAEVIESIPFLEGNLNYSKEAVRIVKQGEKQLHREIERDVSEAFKETNRIDN